MSVGDGIGCSVCEMDTQAAPHSILAVKRVLYVQNLVGSLLFVDRNLPEDKMQPVLVQRIRHALGVRPWGTRKIEIVISERSSVWLRLVFCTVPDIKRRFVAPCLQHQNACREIVLFQVLDLLLCVFLAIPAICRDPHAEHPFRRQNSLSEQLHICADNLRRFTGKGHNGGRFRQIDRHRVLVKMERCSFTGINIQTESAVCPEERSRAICFFTLEAELFFHLIDNDMSFLIQRVIFLAHSVCASIGQAYRQDCAVTHKLHIGARAGYMCLEWRTFKSLHGLPLDTTGHHAVLEILLREAVNENNRDHGNQAARHQDVILRCELTVQCREGNRKRHFCLVCQHKQRPEIVIPRFHERRNRQGRKRRRTKRQCNLKVNCKG